MPRFSTEEYKPDGGFRADGLSILIGALCVAAVGLGLLASFIGQLFYLILLFPAGIGLGLGLVGTLVGRHAKMRNPGMAVFLGLLSSSVAILSMHLFDYQLFLDERQKLLAVAPAPDKLPARIRNDKEALRYWQRVRAVESFPDYLDYKARQGVKIARSPGERGLPIGYVGTWVYWILEWAAVAILTAVMLIGSASAPFCPACNEWKEERRLGTLRKKGAVVAALLNSGEVDRLREHDPTPLRGDLILTAAVCPRCKTASPIAVKLEAVTQHQWREVKKELIRVVYPGEALAVFEELFANKHSLTAEK